MTARLMISLCLLALATQGTAQAAPAALTQEEARHLLIRTGFAPRQAEIEALAGQRAQAAVAAIVTAAQASRPLYPAPVFVAQPPPIPGRFLTSNEERQAARQQQQREGLELKSWWLREMIETPTPLRERMTLFWHNHFATSQQKVGSSQAMWRQQALLRTGALGDFRTLLHGVAKDPAMLIYLDGARSRKEAPNENFAREVMELFTLGESGTGSRYTEQDIREAARAFTGWTVERDDFSFRFRPNLHDDGSKTVLGRTGSFDGDAVLDVMLEQPAAARFIVTKLWKEFVSPMPVEADVNRIAAQFRQSNYDIGVAVQALLLTDTFWVEGNRGSLIKSPVDLVVGTVRQFDFSYNDTTPFALKTAQLNQNLLAPPNVKGWPGQKDWINATTLLERKRFTEQLFRSVEPQAAARIASGGMAAPAKPAGMPGMDVSTMRSVQEMRAAFSDMGMAGDSGAGAPRQAGRQGVMRVANGVAMVSFDPDQWLGAYGGHADREPPAALKARLAQALLPVPPTQAIASGTVGVDYLRMLTLDPAYQLK
ncbi:MAG: DUF1800 domain-containing protein [Polaromonas sp.]|nr:DUF1800 domain-containing protein [Polaromonas sp.]